MVSLKNNGNEADEKLGLLDVLRVLGGLLLLNSMLSYWFTSSTTWGYKFDKYADPRFIKFQLFGPVLNLTLEELSLYNGTEQSLPIYVAVYGKVYDVSSSRAIYGPKGTYHAFAGNDCARLFHNGCFTRMDQCTYDLRGIEDLESLMVDITGWQNYFGNHSRYWQVGTVIHPALSQDSEPPASCVGPRYPGS